MTTDTLSEALVEFPDNRLLIDLCGEYDRNLTEIETRLGVQILRRGNQLTIHGPSDAQAEARDVLLALYQRLEQGRSVSPGDIDREFRMAPDDPGPDAQIEMFEGGPVEIKTRKKLVEPRTDAQKAYVRSLFDNELAFGIGPRKLRSPDRRVAACSGPRPEQRPAPRAGMVTHRPPRQHHCRGADLI